MVDTAETFGVTFTLQSDWQTLTDTLGLLDTKQTYLVWLWLWYA
jgi:hypothetical protein